MIRDVLTYMSGVSAGHQQRFSLHMVSYPRKDKAMASTQGEKGGNTRMRMETAKVHKTRLKRHIISAAFCSSKQVASPDQI